MQTSRGFSMEQKQEHNEMTEGILSRLCGQEFKDSANNLIKLRQAEIQDRAFVNDLTFRTMIEPVSEIWPDESDQDIYFDKNSFDAYPNSTLIMTNPSADEKIGRLTVRFVNDPTKKTDLVMLEEIHLEPSWQGRTIATKIIDELKNLVAPVGIALIVLRKNPAVRLYKKLGFIVRSNDGLDDPYRYFMECDIGTKKR